MRSQSTERPRILLLAREPSIIHLLTSVFTHEELEVETVPTVRDALTRLRTDGRYKTLLVDERSTGVRETRLRLRLQTLGVRVPVMMLPPSLDLTGLIHRVQLMPAAHGSYDTALEAELRDGATALLLRPFSLCWGVAAGVSSTLLYMLELDWRMGWLPIALAVAALRPVHRWLGGVDDTTALQWLELHTVVFFSAFFTWLAGMSLS